MTCKEANWSWPQRDRLTRRKGARQNQSRRCPFGSGRRRSFATRRSPRWLSEDERRRAQRYAFLRDRVRFIAARSFLRRTLGRHRGVDPASLRFAYGLRGRPELEGAPALQFNLSYSGDQALLAVSRDGPLGVDV